MVPLHSSKISSSSFVDHLCYLCFVFVYWSTSGLRVRLARHDTSSSPPVKYFYWPFKGGTSFVDHLCFCGLCFSCFRVCSLLPCGHLLGQDWPLGLVGDVYCISFYFPMWYPGSGVVLDCIVSWSLPSFLFSNVPYFSYYFLFLCVHTFLYSFMKM